MSCVDPVVTHETRVHALRLSRNSPRRMVDGAKGGELTRLDI